MLELRAADLHPLHDAGGGGRALPRVLGQALADARPGAARRLGAAATTMPIATIVLVAINLLVFLAEMAQGVLVSGVSGSGLVDDGAIYGPAIADGEWWRLVTGAFLHAGLIHIAFNMYLLSIIGGSLERYIGSIRFAGGVLRRPALGLGRARW